MADDLESRSTALKIVEAGSMMAMNVLSLVGNILVCISVYRNPRLRTTTNLYIIALAVSDLLAALFVMPLATGVLISGRWPYGETVCQVNAFFSLFVVYASPVTMGLTAINRYVRICRSDQQYRQYFSKTKSRVVLGSAWMFIACYILIPRLTGLQEFQFVPGYAACLNRHLSKFGNMLHYFVVVGLFFLFPLTATIFSYRKVFRKIREHNLATSISSHEIRISRSLFVVVFAFMLCWMPAWIITILTRFQIGGKMPRNVNTFGALCLSLSSAINPFIYAGMNPLFRKEFQKIICCRSAQLVQGEPQTSSDKQNTLSSRAGVEVAAKDENQKAILKKVVHFNKEGTMEVNTHEGIELK